MARTHLWVASVLALAGCGQVSAGAEGGTPDDSAQDGPTDALEDGSSAEGDGTVASDGALFCTWEGGPDGATIMCPADNKTQCPGPYGCGSTCICSSYVSGKHFDPPIYGCNSPPCGSETGPGGDAGPGGD